MSDYAVLNDPESIQYPGRDRFSTAKKFGALLADTMKRDPHFYLFSPDETTSNKLDAVYDVSKRAWALPMEDWDLPESKNGRIVELLSENTLFAAMSGHVLGSREQAMMTSYEAFFTIISSQILQHLKFLKQTDETAWRKQFQQDKYPAINLLSTSTCWRQDHNGFSHQSPALISTLLDVPSCRVNCLFPVDDVAATATYDFMMKSTNVVNLTTFNKTDEPRWIDRNHAKFQFDNGGASIFGFASDDNPDFVFTAAGDIATRESLAAIDIVKHDMPDLRLRFVGVNALCHGSIGTTNNKLPQSTFDEYFTTDKPIIANFHGYADAFKNILTNYTNSQRITAHGFEEQGSTTTPFEMLALNHVSRYDLAMDVARICGRTYLVKRYESIIQENHQYALEHGEDKICIL